MGARPDRLHGLAALRRDRRAPHAPSGRRRRARRRRLRQLRRHSHGRRRDRLSRELQRQHPGQRVRARPGARRRHLPGQGARRRQPGVLRRQPHRPRRHPRRDHGVRGVRSGERGQAADGAGRRSVHREDPARGLPRGDEDRRGGGDPGHGRGRPHQLVARDGGSRRARPASRPRLGAAARAGALGVRDHAVGVAGAHGGGGAPRPRGRAAARVRALGSSRWSRSASSPTTASRSCASAAPPWAASRSSRSPRARRSTGVRSSRPPISRAGRAIPTCRRSATSDARSSVCWGRPSSATSRGSGASTTTRCAATP